MIDWRKAMAAGAMLLVVLLAAWVGRHPGLRAGLGDFFTPFLGAAQQQQWRGDHELLFTKPKVELIQEIERLRQDREQRRLEDAELLALRAENEEMRALLGAPPAPGYRYQLAHLLSREPASGGRRLRLDVGSEAGLAPGQAVIARGFLLGRIFEVSERSAVVMTVADPNCKVSVRLPDAQAYGILIGRGENEHLARPACLVQFLPRDLEYQPGMLVETAEHSQIIPAAIPVGELQAPPDHELTDTVKQLYRNAHVAPGAFARDYRVVAVLVPLAPAVPEAAATSP